MFYYYLLLYIVALFEILLMYQETRVSTVLYHGYHNFNHIFFYFELCSEGIDTLLTYAQYIQLIISDTIQILLMYSHLSVDNE